MARKKDVVVHARLVCSECGRENYHTTRNRQNTREKLNFSRYCKWCRRHTKHKES